MDGRSKAFRKNVCETFAFLKAAHTAQEAADRRLPLAGYEADLVPVCEYHANDRSLIAKLAAWRLVNNWAYPTQFQPTYESTASWLRNQVLNVEDRIMFLVCDRPPAVVVGHIGFAQARDDEQSLKIDNCMRGVKGGYPGIMSSGARALISWAKDSLQARLIVVPVFQDNMHMIQFLARLGFQKGPVTPLRGHEEPGRLCYRPLATGDLGPPDKCHQHMVYTTHGRSAA